jgi:hypothetical protein
MVIRSQERGSKSVERFPLGDPPEQGKAAAIAVHREMT